MCKSILLLTPFAPSNVGAGVNYTRLFIEDMAQTCNIDIIYFRNKADLPYIPSNSNVQILKEFEVSFWKKILNIVALVFIFPLFTAKFNIWIYLYIKHEIRNKKYDAIYFDFSQMFLYAKLLRHKNKILMSHDIITQRYSRCSNRLTEYFCFHTEKWILCTSNTHIFTFSEKDSNLIYNYFRLPSTPTSFYLSENVTSSIPDGLGNYFVFFAMWKRNDNYNGLEWFLENVLPLCNNKVRFKIIGTGLNDRLKEKISHFDTIEYLGFLKNPYPIIASSIALISPLFTGAGVKVKVIEALACGTPIIGTQLSFEGISDEYFNFMLQAEAPSDFVERMLKLDISLDERMEFKDHFLSSYSNKSIKQYINNH